MSQSVWPFAIAWACLQLSGPRLLLGQQDRTLAVESVYAKTIVNRDNSARPLLSMFLVDHKHMMLETGEHDIVIFDWKTGAVEQIVKFEHVRPNDVSFENIESAPAVRAAFLSNFKLHLVLQSRDKVEYVVYNRQSGDSERVDLSGLVGVTDYFCQLPILNGRLLFPRGMWHQKEIVLYDLMERREMRRLRPKAAKREIAALAFSSDGKLAAGAGDSVWVWTLSTGERWKNVYQPPDSIIKVWLEDPRRAGYQPESCAFSQDNEYLAVGTGGGMLLVFDVKSAKMQILEECPWFRHNGTVSFLGNTHFILAAIDEVGIYDMEKRRWEKVHAFVRGEGQGVFLGAVVVDSSIVTFDYDGRLRRFSWLLEPSKESKQ